MIAVIEAQMRDNIGAYLSSAARGEEVEIRRNGEPLALMSSTRLDKVLSWKRDGPMLRLRHGTTASQMIIQERNDGSRCECFFSRRRC